MPDTPLEKVWVGDKKIKGTTVLEEKTPAGVDLIEVEYTNGKKEVFSKTMLDVMVHTKACDASELQERRIHPVVGSMLAMLREYGVKVGELSYMSTLLNQSMNNNKDEAEKELWSKFLPTIQSLDDVDLITVDRVLRTKPPKPAGEIPSPKEFYEQGGEKHTG